MATYYKYAERKASDEINWAEVGKNLTDMLKEENKIREDKKAAIDKASREFGETLANAPTGESTSLNTYSLKFADNLQQARLLQDRLLKSGQLKLKDYTIMRQNLTDGTDNAFGLIKEYQDEFKRKMDRANATNDPKERSQLLERFYMQSAEGFMNFANSELYINPTNYQVSVGKKNADGSMSTNPNDFQTVNDLRNRIKQDINYFDYNKQLENYVGSIAKYSTVVQAAGGWKVINDPMAREKYIMSLDPATQKQVRTTINQMQASIDNELKSYNAGNPYNYTSILTDDIGGYSFTFDPDEADKDVTKILLKKDPNNVNGPAIPDFSTANGKEQEKAAFEFLKTQLAPMLERTETYSQKTQRMFDYNAAKWGQEQQEKADAMNVWNKLHTATTAEERNAAINTIVGMERNQQRGLVDIIFSDDGGKVTFKYTDSKMDRTIPYSKNTNLLQWAEMGNEVTGVDDAKKVFQLSGGGNPNAPMADYDGLKKLRSSRTGGTTMTTGLTQSVINSNIDAAFKSVGEDDATGMANALSNSFADTGFTFVPKEDTGISGTKDDVEVYFNGVLIDTYQVDNDEDLIRMKNDMANPSKAVQSAQPTPAPQGGGASNSGGKPRGG